ncbi:hypothetical protein HQ40_01985 [Porphyromonas gulae]|uniref:hypothetical protein n=1 Tax=Porphyromonas gulae TaxID=111105 RepID=UPI00052E04C9|nr:hypothetical protein [Porphyromonas gulae]KGN76890.1 hypothetical protein HQ40_01985 [Porphyromonas gulae]
MKIESIYKQGYSDQEIGDMLISDPDVLKVDGYAILIVKEEDRWLHTGDSCDLDIIESVLSRFERGELKVSDEQTLKKSENFFAHRGGSGYIYCVYDI